MEQYWFQQDGATAHTAAQSRDLLKSIFNERLITKFEPRVASSLLRFDAIRLFLWGYVKSLVYVDRPTTLDALKANIMGVINEIKPKLLEKVTKNWTDRLAFVKSSRGGHMC